MEFLTSPAFAVVGIAAMVGWVFTTWLRVKHGYPLEGEWGGTTNKTDVEQIRKVQLLETENGKLAGQVSRLEERIAVLERIATDKPSRLADQIDNLR